ncbi:MAG: hypothetical protein WD645_01960 [Dehalococcoidia bacterium]
MAVIITGTLLGVLAGCSPEGKLGDPSLPPGFASSIPATDLRGFLYVNTGSPVALPANTFGEAAIGPVDVLSIQAVLNRASSEYAARIEFADAGSASLAGEATRASASDDQWVDNNDRHLMTGRSGDGDWTEELRTAWNNDDRETLEDAYPAVWATMRLLPEEPPAEPVAAGFLRSVDELAEDVLSASGVSGTELGSALTLMRVEAIAFAVYADDLERLPEALTRADFEESEISALAVATAGYSGFIVNFLFPRFSERAGLEETELDGKVVFYRALDNDLHLVMKNYGSAFFFALSSTRGGAEDLARSVIASQESR